MSGAPWSPWLLKGCGTEAAYRRHLRHGEKPCRACTEAQSRENLRRAVEKRATAERGELREAS